MLNTRSSHPLLAYYLTGEKGNIWLDIACVWPYSHEQYVSESTAQECNIQLILPSKYRLLHYDEALRCFRNLRDVT